MKMNKTKLRHGSFSMALILIVLAAVVLLNLVVGALTDRFSLKADMTAGGIYDITDQTREALQTLSTPVTFHVLMDKSAFETGDTTAQVNEMLLRYKAIAGDMITLNYVDIYKNPAFVNNYDTATSLTQGSIIVESEKRYKALTLSDLYQIRSDYQSGTRYISGFQAEQKLSSAIDFVTKETLPKAYILEGHGEVVSPTFKSTLELANFTVEPLNLSMNDIPEDATLLVLSSPTSDYTAEEVKKIDSFLYNDFGQMMVFYGPETPETPVLSRYFEEWGVAIEQAYVFDPDRTVGTPVQIAPNFNAEEKMVESLAAASDQILVVPYARQVRQLWEEGGQANMVSKILTTGPNAYTKRYDAADGSITTVEQESGDETGAFDVALLAEYLKYVDNVPNYGRILFVGTPYVMSDSLMQTENYLNSNFITAAATYMSGETDTVVVTPKKMQSEQLILVGTGATVVFWLVVVLLPAAILVLGIWQWLRRKHL